MSDDAGELVPSERVGEGSGDGAKTPFPFRAAAAAEGLPPWAREGPWDRSWEPSEGGAVGSASAAAAAAPALDSSRCLSPGSWIRMPPRALPGPEAILAGKASLMGRGSAGIDSRILREHEGAEEKSSEGVVVRYGRMGEAIYEKCWGTWDLGGGGDETGGFMVFDF